MASINYTLFNSKFPLLYNIVEIQKHAPFEFSKRISGEDVILCVKRELFVRSQAVLTQVSYIEKEILALIPDEKTYLLSLDELKILYCFEDKKASFPTSYSITYKSKEEDKVLGSILALNKAGDLVNISTLSGAHHMAEYLFASNRFINTGTVNVCGNFLALELWAKITNKAAEKHLKLDVIATPMGLEVPELNTNIISKYAKKSLDNVSVDVPTILLSELIEAGCKLICNPEVEVEDDLRALPADVRVYASPRGVIVVSKNYLCPRHEIETLLGSSEFEYIFIGG